MMLLGGMPMRTLDIRWRRTWKDLRPNGEFDWIVVDPDIDFAAMYAGSAVS